MRLNTNISALSAFNALSANNKSLSKAIRQVSTGLRINSAADDAAGLAISENMRSQVRGLDAAVRNTEDGISLLQTAEGALTSTTSILQRMRELSVQAANGILTQQDRAYIQEEIGQLKTEVDRIAKTTQFNKKKIINGEAGIEWSSTSSGVKATVNGSAGSIDITEGNYKLEVRAVQEGQAQVQKSRVLNVQRIDEHETWSDFDININDGMDTLGYTSGDGWSFESNHLNITGDGTYSIIGNLDGSGGTITTSHYIRVESGVNAVIILRDVDITAAEYAFRLETGANVDVWLDPGEHNNPNVLKANEGGWHTSALQAGAGSTLTISSMMGDYSTEGRLIAMGSEHGAGIGGSCSSGVPTAGDITIYGGTIEATGGYYAAGIGGGWSGGSSGNITIYGGDITAQGGPSGGAGIGSGGYGYSVIENTGTITLAGGTIKATGGDTGNNGYGESGQGAGVGGGGHFTGGTIRINNGLDLTVDGFTDDGQTESIGYGQYAGNSGSTNIIYEDITTPEARAVPVKPQRRVESGVEFIDYKLYEIEQFYDDNGNFLLETPQKLTVTQGNGASASIMIYGNDTMYEVAEKLNDAISEELGQGKYTDDATKFCTIADGGHSSEAVYNADFDDDVVRSTMLVRSLIPGREGELTFSGSQELLDFFQFNTIRSSAETTYSTTITDAHTGESLALDIKTTGRTLHGAIDPNIDVEFDAMTGLQASWDNGRKSYVLDKAGTYSAVLHVKDSSLKLQVGANEGERFSICLGDMSCQGLGLEGVNVLSQDSASRAITIIDNAIDKVLTQRAQIGASQNTLEHTMSQIITASENLSHSESRIRDADMAKAMIALTNYRIITQTAESMLAQANQLPQAVLSLLR